MGTPMANDQLNQARIAISTRKRERESLPWEHRSTMAFEQIADELILIRALLQQSQGIPDEKPPSTPYPGAPLAG